MESERTWKEAVNLDQRDFTHLQHELEASRIEIDDRSWENESLKMTINYLEECGENVSRELKDKIAQVTEENTRLTVVQAHLESTKEAQQQMLDNIRDFGTRVYRRWNLLQNFARKIQAWVTIKKKRSKRHEIAGCTRNTVKASRQAI